MPNLYTKKEDLVVLTELLTNLILNSTAATPPNISNVLPDISTAGIGTLESIYLGYWMEYLYAKNLLASYIDLPDYTDMTSIASYVRDKIDVEETFGNSLTKVA